MGKEVKFPKQEAEILLGLIDKTIKNEGLSGNVDRNGVYFQDKLNNAFKEEPKDNDTPQ